MPPSWALEHIRADQPTFRAEVHVYVHVYVYVYVRHVHAHPR